MDEHEQEQQEDDCKTITQSSYAKRIKKKKKINPIEYESCLNKEQKVYSYCNSPKERCSYSVIKKENGEGIIKNRISYTIKNKGNFFLSPYYPASFISDHGVYYKSVYHYMQSKEFPGERIQQQQEEEQQQQCNTNNMILSQMKWQYSRDFYFNHANYCKFTQNPELSEALIKTYPLHIIEESNDNYWGIGKLKNGRWTGKNKAGKIIMSVREMIRKQLNMECKNEECLSMNVIIEDNNVNQ